MKKNLFITLEGIDGSGKSTQAKNLAQKLSDLGHKVYLTAEPSNGPIGKMLRQIFKGEMKADHKTVAALFLADRFEHILHEEEGLIKKIEEGYTVICDRYYFSSYAYNAVHLPMDWVIAANKPCAALLRPDVNIYIDIKPEISMERINLSRENLEMYESLENLTEVRNNYLAAFELLKAEENILMIDGHRKESEITEEILEKLHRDKPERESFKSLFSVIRWIIFGNSNILHLF